MTKNLFKRTVILAVGLFVMALGVSLSIKANLGTSPISSVPFVYSLKLPFTIGIVTVSMHVIFIFLQIIILRKDYKLIQLFQLVVAFVFGFFTDFTFSLVSATVYVSNYLLQWLLCLVSTAIIAFGVFLEVKSKVIYLAGEGLVLAISQRFKIDFGKVKVGFDSSLVIISLISSLIFFHSLKGIREGTIASALLVGTCVRFFNKKLSFVDLLLGNKEKIPGKNVIVQTLPHAVYIIGREYGSGGHLIGEKLAADLGIAFYDSELIKQTAIVSGYTKEYIQKNEQKLANELLFSLYEQNYVYANDVKPPLDVLFMIQSKIIREIAQKESCVIVGRCAEFVLKDNPFCFSVFIHGDKKHRMQRIIEEYNIPSDKAASELETVDRKRANYYAHYTHSVWGTKENYNLIIDSSVFGIDKSVEVIKQAALIKTRRSKN